MGHSSMLLQRDATILRRTSSGSHYHGPPHDSDREPEPCPEPCETVILFSTKDLEHGVREESQTCHLEDIALI
jgi:hypothetical protein